MQIPNHIKLSDLTRSIQKIISNNFFNKTFWVIAEISNLKYYPAKNYYFFDLIEKDTVSNNVLTSIKGTAWSTSVNRIKNFEYVTGQKFDSNIQVLLSVSVEYHITYGLKLNLLDVDPSFTLGNLERQRQQTLQRLLIENPGFIQFSDGQYTTFNKSLQINPVIQHIALIASQNSDGYNDFKHELENNHYHYLFNIDEYPAQVQGGNSDEQIVNRLVQIFTSGKIYDAVVIVRGGGTQADFLIFDSYELAKAIAKFPIPVFTGIGHTRNESIADMMAYSAVKTPTKVAESIISHNRFFEEKIINTRKAIVSKTNEIIAFNKLSLSQVKSLLQSKSKDIVHTNDRDLSALKSIISELAMRKIIASKQAIERHSMALKNAATSLITKNQFRLDGHAQLVKHLSPDAVLKRGYALVYQNGKIVVDPEKIEAGSEIITLLANTEIISTVKNKKSNNA